MSKKQTSPQTPTCEPFGSHVAQSRSEIKMLSREQLDGQTIQTVYKEGYTTLTVKSIFSGNESLTDLFYQILQHKLTNYEEAVVQYNGNQSANVVPQVSEGGTTQC